MSRRTKSNDAMNKPEGYFKCMACGKVWSGEKVLLDSSRLGWNYLCGDYFCGMPAMKFHEQQIKRAQETAMASGLDISEWTTFV